ncbi:Unknown protein, partial [Striga hermonthica]
MLPNLPHVQNSRPPHMSALHASSAHARAIPHASPAPPSSCARVPSASPSPVRTRSLASDCQSRAILRASLSLPAPRACVPLSPMPIAHRHAPASSLHSRAIARASLSLTFLRASAPASPMSSRLRLRASRYHEGRRCHERRDEGRARYHERDDPRDDGAGTRPKIVMPTFTGTDPDAWLSRAVQFFEINDVPRYERVQIAAYHLDGEVNVWWQWMMHKNHGEYMRWRDFKKELITRFGSSDYHDYNEALSRIKQVGSLRDYQKEFERIASRVRDWPEAALVGTFVGGLKAELAAEVRLERPGSMRAAI